MRSQPPIDYARESDLTIEELRASVTFSELTDEQAQEVLNTIKSFTEIVFYFYKKGLQNDKEIVKIS
jgi:hypothetical protein